MAIAGGKFINGFMNPYANAGLENTGKEQPGMDGDVPYDDGSGQTGPSTSGTDTVTPGTAIDNTGVAGDQSGATPVPDLPKTPTAATGDFSRLTGYDQGKYNDPNKQSAKYVIGRTLSQFDPSKGFNDPAVIAALNALGYGTFSGANDRLSLSGLTDKGRAAGLTGDYKDADFNVGFKTGNGKWGYADPVAEAAQGGVGLDPNNPPQAGSASPTGGITTNVSDDLKSLLSKYYGSGGGMRFNQGSSLVGNHLG